MPATTTFLYSDIFALHGSETMRKIPSFLKLLTLIIYIDGLRKKTLMISILLRGKSLVQRARFPARISGMENMEICSSLLMLSLFFNNKLYKNNEAEIGEKIRTK